MDFFKILLLSLSLPMLISCQTSPNASVNETSAVNEHEVLAVEEPVEEVKPILPGAFLLDKYVDKLQDKRVGLVVNHTSLVGQTHLVDTLLSKGINIPKIYTPEHGFKGIADAGEKVNNSALDEIEIISLYGNNKKPNTEAMQGIDMMVFDLQDVGARFYTYISTMHYIMEACAENNISLLILDRPNPNGFYVDGPIRKKGFESFVGIHPIPIVHGLTVGELAQMINGEGWLKGNVTCDIDIVQCANYDHTMTYDLPVKPSPNLPNAASIYYYPSICFFEGTEISVGRGTNTQFQVIGNPLLKDKLTGDVHEYTPVSMEGAKYPKHENKTCYGYLLDDSKDFFSEERGKLNLNYLIMMYKAYPDKDKFFLKNNFIDKLAGTDELRKQIQQGLTADEIRLSWQTDLEEYKAMRKQYLLYPDFTEE